MNLKKILVLLTISLVCIKSGATSFEPMEVTKNINENCTKGYIVIKFKLVTNLDKSNKQLKTVKPIDISIVEIMPKDTAHGITVKDLGKLQFTYEFASRMKPGDDGYYTQRMNIVSNSTCATANKSLNEDATDVAPIS